MTRSEIWTLTVHFYPEAAKAGVRPIDKQWFSGDHEPCHYRSHTFHFSRPPSRADFLAMVRRLPWAYHAWQDDLLPLIELGRSDWPMVDFAYKSAQAEIRDDEGKHVGHLDVDRVDLYEAGGYDRNAIFVPCDDENAVANRVPKDKRSDASLALLYAENRIKERISLEKPEKVNVRQFIRDELVKAGFLKAKNKAEATS